MLCTCSTTPATLENTLSKEQAISCGFGVLRLFTPNLSPAKAGFQASTGLSLHHRLKRKLVWVSRVCSSGDYRLLNSVSFGSPLYATSPAGQASRIGTPGTHHTAGSKPLMRFIVSRFLYFSSGFFTFFLTVAILYRLIRVFAYTDLVLWIPYEIPRVSCLETDMLAGFAQGLTHMRSGASAGSQFTVGKPVDV